MSTIGDGPRQNKAHASTSHTATGPIATHLNDLHLSHRSVWYGRNQSVEDLVISRASARFTNFPPCFLYASDNASKNATQIWATL
jgi:hypothetical protein